MIDRVVLRNFKRFGEVAFDLRGSHVVLAGPNNMGKTTVLQAIAAWDLAWRTWREREDVVKHNGSYAKAPIARPNFSAVSLRSFDLLWRDKRAGSTPIEIEIRSTDGLSVAMEFVADTSEQIFVRPRKDTAADALRKALLSSVFVPAMSGLEPDEKLYAVPEAVNLFLGQGRPGQVLRNLLVEAHQRKDSAWSKLTATIQRLFGFRLEAPQVGGVIVANYTAIDSGVTFDIASAGSGFQQVLMLLTFLHVRPGSVLLVDEPDAHLHVILQDAIFHELRAVAAEQRSQLVIATHSEVIINSVAPEDLYLLFDPPRRLADTEEQRRLVQSLARLPNADIMVAAKAPGILYFEDYTDLDILREFARVLGHPAFELLAHDPFWKPVVWQPRPDAQGVRAKHHYDAITLARPGLPALEITDGDGDPQIPETTVTGSGFQRVRWRRYEIESYLVHPAALERFVVLRLGDEVAAKQATEDLRRELVRVFRADFVESPFADNPLVEAYFKTTKARTSILPPLLTAAGLPGFPYQRFYEIAAVMKPDEIHPEVREKLDLICKAFGR